MKMRLRCAKDVIIVAACWLFVAGQATSGSAATVGAGHYHSVVLNTTDGTVWSWGSGAQGQLGNGQTNPSTVPVQVSNLTGITAVAAGQYHTLALKYDGTVWAWGYNSNGQLGIGNYAAQSTPVQVTGITGTVTAIAAGASHSIALTSDGGVWTWGYNANGQLGSGNTTSRNTPGQIASFAAVAISAGENHSLAVLADGTAKAWGENTYNQLGNGTTTQATSPTAVSSLTGAASTAAGLSYSFAAKSDGTAWVWGLNNYNQLGDGTTTQRSTPVQLASVSGVARVSAGHYHGVALKTDGTVTAWGWNGYGSVGDGTTTQRSTPTAVSTLSGVSDLAAGRYHSIAVTGDGTVWAWGENGNGQIGDGTAGINRLAPVKIAEAGFTWLVASPVFNPAPGTYTNTQSVAITSATPAATIRYTTDGSEPTTSSATYTGAVSLTSSTQLLAKAFKSGLADSAVSSATYTLKVATPSFSPGGSTYSSAQTATISTSSPGVELRYTTDGSQPTAASPQYVNPLSIGTTTTLKARGFRNGWTDSDVASATYTMNFGTLSPPSMSPAPGSFVSGATVTLTATAGAEVRYTTNGTDPTTASTLYVGPIAVGATTTLKARAYALDYAPSTTATGVYTISVAAPVFSAAAGTYAAGQMVTVTTATPGATIYYTVAGATPTASDATIASGGSLTLGAYTLRAFAAKAGCTSSDITSADYSVTGASTQPGAAGGYDHALVLRTDGTVWSWGAGGNGQLGNGGWAGSLVPVQVNALTGVVAVAAGGYHSLALKSDGTVWAWGGNGHGQLGDNTTTGRNAPVPVAGISGAVAIAAGEYHAVALTSDGQVWTWGYNGYGQLGDGGTTSRSLASGVASVTASAIGAGAYHTVAVLSGGGIKAWGQNASGQLGNGTQTQSSLPVSVTGASSMSGAAGGLSTSLAWTTSGVAWVWGQNSYNELGDGTTTLRSTPVSLAGLGSVSRLAAGYYHGVALKTDGTASAWGWNGYGSVGDGTTTQRATPTPVTGISGIERLGVGRYHNVAIATDGTIWAWGLNSSGQLGDGTTTNRLVPIKVSDAGFAWKAGTPTISVASGVYTSSQSVSLSTATVGGTIRYTTDGSEPTAASTAYSGPLTVDAVMTLRAKTFKTGLAPSNTASATYSFEVATPTLSPGAGTYSTDKTVTVSCAVSGAVIRYTTNGVDPTGADPTIASGATLLVDRSLTLKAKAFKAGWLDSSVATATYTMTVAQPAMSLPAGTYSGTQGVTVTIATPGATIRYTTNALEPTEVDSVVAAGGSIVVDHSLTLKVKAFRTGWTASTTTSAIYVINAGASAATPTFTPPAGTYSAAQDVTIGTLTAGGVIRYTLDGSDPAPSSPLYLGPVRVDSSLTLKARAYRQGATPSAVASAGFVINSGAVATPELSPAGGLYTTTRTVTVSTATAGATIRYTTSGADPTPTDPSIASGSTITVDRATIVKARAWKTGLADSGVRRGDYIITGSLAAGDRHVVALKADGTVWTWGANDAGQLGDGTSTNRSTPTQVAGLTGVVRVAAGYTFSVALKSDGSVWVWGSNGNGQLGDGTTTTSLTPKQVAGLTGVAAIAAGQNHVLTSKTDGSAWSWGANSIGQLGDNSQTERRTPVQVVGLGNVVALAAGWQHSLALKMDGTVWSWGGNGYGQLGDGTNTTRLSPIQVPSMSGVSRLAAGAFHSGVLQTDGLIAGTWWAWGNDASGQLGDNRPATTSVTPIAITGGNFQIAAGQGETFVIRAAGTVWGAGQNGSGQLGNGGTTNSYVPVRASILRDAWALAAGSSFAVAEGANGAVWTWGDNSWGQLAASAARRIPGEVSGFRLVTNDALDVDQDGDGLTSGAEYRLGTDPLDADSNGDGIPDSLSDLYGPASTNLDMDGDGLTNAAERDQGTDPFTADSDGDGVPDGADCAPLNPSASQCVADPGDHTAPTLTLLEPPNATLVP